MIYANTRRGFINFAGSAITTSAVISVPWFGLALQRTPQPLPSPNAPTNQNAPAGLNNYPNEAPSRQVAGAVNPEELKRMVGQLYQLALEMKTEADKLDLKSTLPLDFVLRTKQIEKLAKSIRTRILA